MTSFRLPPLRRFFQLQIPQVFRPTVSSVLANTVGHVNLEAPATTLSVVSYWVRFARWCRLHPIPVGANGAIVGNKEGLYESVIQNESLDRESFLYLFGIRCLSGSFSKMVAHPNVESRGTVRWIRHVYGLTGA